MNMKKFSITVVAVLVVTMVTNFVIHQVLLKDMYAATASLWRPEAEMQGLMHYMLLGQLVTAIAFAWIFIHGYKGTGIMEGVRYGLLMGLFQAGGNMIMYVVAPYTCALVTAWTVAGFVQSVLVGVVASFTYKA